MSDDLEGMAYESRLYEGPRVPPPEWEPGAPDRGPRRRGFAESLARIGSSLRRPMAILLIVCTLLVGLTLLVPPPGDRPVVSDEALGTPVGGLLADLRGEDVIHRLETTQAALKREMAMIREAVATRGGVPLPDDVDTAYALAAHTAELEYLGALVQKFAADQRRLRDLVEASQAGLAFLSHRLANLEQALEAQAAGEGS